MVWCFPVLGEEVLTTIFSGLTWVWNGVKEFPTTQDGLDCVGMLQTTGRNSKNIGVSRAVRQSYTEHEESRCEKARDNNRATRICTLAVCIGELQGFMSLETKKK